jgi:hypothetical protein
MKKLSFILLIMLGLYASSHAQRVISGTVKDEKGEPIVGASVILKGKMQGVLTDENGQYRIAIPSDIDTLTYSFVGYESQNIAVLQEKNINIALNQGILLETFVKVEYSGCRLRYCCCGVLGISQGWGLNNIAATPLSNGYTKLQYELYARYDTIHRWDWIAKDKLNYEIYKSKDDFDYKKIGISLSAEKIKKDIVADSVHLYWGFSHFVDTEVNSDTAYYLVKGYANNENSGEKYYAYEQKIKVPPTNTLKINNLYLPKNSNIIELTVSSPQDGDADIFITDMNGRLILKNKQFVLKNKNTILVDGKDMASGLYILSMAQGQYRDNRKFVVVN